jgi:DNA (cytosine-5)-methyltransferase 1|tara:strand:+ start:1103 stop:2008 length:906 start_codon:yes stop_codon:yes gene_type:complete
MGMKVGSFCSGFGGLDLAAHDLFDATTSWWSEIDSAAQKVMHARFPEAQPVGDITTLNPHDLEPVDVLTAGFPCQPYSTAGLRKGQSDERAIFQWIADTISVLRPRYILLENVQGILTKGGTDTLASLTSVGGYRIRWGLVRASDAGCPHRRARWFAVAESADSYSSSSETWGSAGYDSERFREEFVGHSSPSADSDDAGRSEHSGAFPMETEQSSFECRSSTNWGEWEPAIRRWETIRQVEAPPPVIDGKLNQWFVEWMMGLPTGWVCDVIDKRTPALKMLGNGCVPQQAHLAFSLLLNK